jgi:hypothetical protein
MHPVLSVPVPELARFPTEWSRSYPIRYRSLYPLFRNGSDTNRADAGAYTSSSGMDPTLSDPIPELRHDLPVWHRSYPIRYWSLCTLYWDEADPICSGTGAYTLSFGVEPIRSDPIPELIHHIPQHLGPYPTRHWSLCIPFRNGSDPIQKIRHPRSERIRSYPIRYRSLHTLVRSVSDEVWLLSSGCDAREFYSIAPGSEQEHIGVQRFRIQV